MRGAVGKDEPHRGLDVGQHLARRIVQNEYLLPASITGSSRAEGAHVVAATSNSIARRTQRKNASA